MFKIQKKCGPGKNDTERWIVRAVKMASNAYYKAANVYDVRNKIRLDNNKKYSNR